MRAKDSWATYLAQVEIHNIHHPPSWFDRTQWCEEEGAMMSRKEALLRGVPVFGCIGLVHADGLNEDAIGHTRDGYAVLQTRELH